MSFASMHNDYLDPDKNGVNEEHMAEVDFDEAYSVSTGEDTVYFDVAESNEKWFMSAVIDCDSAHFTDSLVSDDGPFKTEVEALRAGLNCALDWFLTNQVQEQWEVDSRLRDKLNLDKQGNPRKQRKSRVGGGL